MTHGGVWWWREVLGLLRRVSKASGVPLNRLVNLAVLDFLGCKVDVEVLRLEARKLSLLREEADIRKTWCAIARSGSYLEQYAARVLQPQEYRELLKVEGREFGAGDVRDGRVPLKALSPREEQLFKRMCARREEIASELVDIELKLLPRKRWRWRSKRRSKSPRTKVTEKQEKEVKT